MFNQPTRFLEAIFFQWTVSQPAISVNQPYFDENMKIRILEFSNFFHTFLIFFVRASVRASVHRPSVRPSVLRPSASPRVRQPARRFRRTAGSAEPPNHLLERAVPSNFCRFRRDCRFRQFRRFHQIPDFAEAPIPAILPIPAIPLICRIRRTDPESTPTTATAGARTVTEACKNRRYPL